MKKVATLIIILFSELTFAQSITIKPDSSSEFIIKRIAETPTIVGASAQGTSSAMTVSTLGNQFLSLEGRGYNGSNFITKGSILFLATENWSSISNGTKITFNTTPNGTSTIRERMTIENNGNVGVGLFEGVSPSPLAKLHINNGSSGVAPNAGQFAPTLFMERDNHNYLEIAAPIDKEMGLTFRMPNASGGVYFSSNTPNGLSFRTNTNTLRMMITAEGNVSIGNSTPLARLVVEGDFALKGFTTSILNGGSTNLDREGKSIINFAAGSSATIRGIAGGVEGMILYLLKEDAATLNINDNDGTAPLGNRIFTHTGANFTSANGSRLGGITLIYINNYWRIVSIAE